jgi:predicted RNA binding protein YcfA (HicA-like mRNA interferase family)
MSQWGSRKARLVLAALLQIGWQIKRQSGGSHRVLARPGWADFVFAFHDGEEIGPRMLASNCSADGLASGGPLKPAELLPERTRRLRVRTIHESLAARRSAPRSTTIIE